MTVWHDQPPRSRRDARRNARMDEATPEPVTGDAVDADVVSDPSAVPPHADSPGTNQAAANEPAANTAANETEPVLEPEGDDAPRSTPERPLTRRELRELRARAAAAAQPTMDHAPGAATEVAGEIPAEVVDAEHVDDDVVEAEVVESEAGETPVTDDAVSDDAATDDAVSDAAVPDAASEAPVAATDTDPADPEDPTTPGVEDSAAADDSAAVDDGAEGDDNAEGEPSSLTPFDVVFAPPSDAGVVDGSSDQNPATPYRHWSTQAALDDLEPGSDGATSRNVGVSTGAITTHALVLPSSPESGDQLLTPLTNTGEIMVTGSVDLPRSFGSTGAHPVLFDSPDVDALIDASDREDAPAGAAPVRAIRAVASSGSARSVIEAPAPAKSRLPLVLGGIGGGLLLVAIGVAIAAVFFNVT